MFLTEYNKEKVMEKERAEGRAEGRVEGLIEGQNQLGELMIILKHLGRVDDAFKAASDPAFRQKLFYELMYDW